MRASSVALWGLWACAPTDARVPVGGYVLTATGSEVPELPASIAVELSAGREQLCARDTDGRTRCFGQWPPPPAVPFRDVAVGDGIACGVLPSGEIDCWGSDDPARFAERLREQARSAPARAIAFGASMFCALFDDRIECEGEGAILDEEGDFADLAIGRWGIGSELDVRCALDTEGALYCDQAISPYDPTFMSFERVDDGPFVRLVGEDGGVCAFRRDGTSWCLGMSAQDELWLDLAKWDYQSCGVTYPDGRVLCWPTIEGFNDVSFPGDGYSDVAIRPTQVCAIDAHAAVICEDLP